jgi:hypothetical protein
VKSQWIPRIGWVVSAIPALMILFGGTNMVLKTPMVMEGLVKAGYPAASLLGIGLAATISAILYLIPRTATLGAILLTGYLGGAVATHVRAEEPYGFAVAFGVLVWAGLWARDPRVRSILS